MRCCGGMAMKDDAVKLRAFKGRLGVDGHEIPIAFNTRIDRVGALRISVEEVPLTDDTRFIMDAWHRAGDYLAYFRLSGDATDGMTFETARLYFNSIGPHFDAKRGSYYVFDAACDDASFKEPLSMPV